MDEKSRRLIECMMGKDPPTFEQILRQNCQKIDTNPIQIPSLDLRDLDKDYISVRAYSSSVSLTLEKRTGIYWTAKKKKLKDETLLMEW